MQKNKELLQWGLPLLALLLIVGGAAFTGQLLPVKADGGSCTGDNNSSSSDSDCNSNTPYPSPGSCQLAWINGGGGSVTLDASQVTDDSDHPGLKETLAGYNLRCASDVNVSSCQLVPGANDSGNTKLDLANVINRSPWIYAGLNGKYGLNCS